MNFRAGAGVIFLAALIVFNAPDVSMSANPAVADSFGDIWLPFSPAPVGQWGGVLSGEYDRRWLGNDLVKTRRFLFRIGNAPARLGALWIECGAATFDMTTGTDELKGDYGLAMGGGWTVTYPRLQLSGFQPFISGRATYLQAFLKYEKVVSNVTQTTDSRFVWQEASGVIGVFSKLLDKYVIHCGVKLRTLYQDEFRNVRTSNSDDDYQYIYRSGVKPGAEITVLIPLRNRFSISLTAELFLHSQVITLTFGQWGKPG